MAVIAPQVVIPGLNSLCTLRVITSSGVSLLSPAKRFSAFTENAGRTAVALKRSAQY